MYIEYKPISTKGDSSSYIPLEMAEAQSFGIKGLPPSVVNDFDEWVASKIGLSKEDLWRSFSAEQIDTIGLSIFNFELGKNFIIADETGIGKGRILAGISLYAWNNNLNILFFTEREHLLTEFWKDLNDVDALKKVINPIVFHSTSKIYDGCGNVAIKGSSKIVRDIEINGFNNNTNLVLTNYSQISLKQHKVNKTESLLKYCEKSILILDESHNGCGDSNTKKLLIQLTEKSKGVVFSSATFIKDESQLELYSKSFSLDKDTLSLLTGMLKTDKKGYLRKLFTYELTKKLQFWRREHQPLDVGWNMINCSNEQEIEILIQKYSEVINGLFTLVNEINYGSPENNLLANAWFELGATINRLSRNLLLVLKIDTLVEAVKNSIKNNHKAVIVLDSTLASISLKVNERYGKNKDGSINTDFKINFGEAVKYIIDEILYDYMSNNDINHEYYTKYKSLLKLAESFSNLSISPIDTIIEKLSENNISCGEISGRTFKISDSNIVKLNSTPKTEVVRQFNNGQTDVVIITRAGASGISLHASAAFKDQRVRDLYELEITNRPTYRLQFIGRVNRKNQVAQPLFYTITTKLPFEQRILNIEQNKLKTLQSHISGDDEKHSQENILNLYNEYTDKCAKQYLLNHPKLAFQMGINLKVNKDDLYYIDSILKRCIVLSSEQQSVLYNFLLCSVEISNLLQRRKNHASDIKINNITTFWHDLDASSKDSFKKMFSISPELSINQFVFPWVGLMEYSGLYNTNFQASIKLNSELSANKEKHCETLPTFFNLLYKNYKLQNKYCSNEQLNHVIRVISNIKLGKCLKLNTEDGKIFGYINDVIIPDIDNPYIYTNLITIHIKTINPHIHEKLTYSKPDYYITIDELFNLDQIEFTENDINWTQFEKPSLDYVRSNLCFVGHPVYLQFLKEAYGFGELHPFNINSKKYICLTIPPQYTVEKLKTIKKPIYFANQIMAGLMSKKIKSLSTGWQDEKIVKPIFKIEPTSGGYNFMVAQEVNRNFDIIDFALKKRIGNNSGNLNGYFLYHIAYKQIRGLLWALQQKNVIWFINQ